MTSTTEAASAEQAHEAPHAHASHEHGHGHGHGHAGHGATPAAHGAEAHGQTHPLKLYLVVWVALFVLSTFSYLIDYFNFQGYLRWSLILLFMVLKAGAIVAIFMHMAWERLALVYAILLPPLALTVFMGMMALEGGYTNGSREAHFDPPVPIAAPAHEGAAAAAAHETAPPASQPAESPHAWAPEWLGK